MRKRLWRNYWPWFALVLSINAMFIVICVTYLRVLRISQPVAIISSEVFEQSYIYQGEMNFRRQIQGVTTKQDRTWCDEILSQYDSSNETLIDEAYFRDRKFASQYNQDWLMFSSIFQHIQRQAVYIDLAAHQFKTDSNTYFFDKCLSWNGLCIEAEPKLIPKLELHRTCDIVNNCIWSDEQNLTFMRSDGNGRAGLEGFNKINDRGRATPMKCSTLQNVMNERNMFHVDYLSLDIEGSELPALQGVDWGAVQIDVITVEGNDACITEYLEQKGFVKKYKIYEDLVFIHSNARKKMYLFDRWLEQKKMSQWPESPVIVKKGMKRASCNSSRLHVFSN